jgi:Ca2+-binding EF-hand superfamily protein
MTEFTCLLTVLKIDFSQENLRKLIRLTDSNNDGRISMNEFDKMISSQRLSDLRQYDDEMIEEVQSSDEEAA